MRIVIIALVFIGLEIVLESLRRRRLIKLVDLLTRGQLKEFEKKIDSFSSKLLVSSFNRDYMLLNKYFLNDEEDKAIELLDKLKNKKLNKQQRESVAMMGFSYYLGVRNSEEAKYYHDELNVLGTIKPETLDSINLTYEVIIEKRTDSLDKLLEDTDKLADKDKAANETLIAEIYHNLGDEANYKKYQRLADKHVKLLEKDIQQHK